MLNKTETTDTFKSFVNKKSFLQRIFFVCAFFCWRTA